jgi:hypothetical protein
MTPDRVVKSSSSNRLGAHQVVTQEAIDVEAARRELAEKIDQLTPTHEIVVLKNDVPAAIVLHPSRVKEMVARIKELEAQIIAFALSPEHQLD